MRFESPRLQTAVAISASENLDVRILSASLNASPGRSRRHVWTESPDEARAHHGAAKEGCSALIHCRKNARSVEYAEAADAEKEVRNPPTSIDAK
jgi:hypothetical protein